MILVWLFISAAARADAPPCASRPDLVDTCRTVHGRLFVANGIPLRIWVVGTKRVLAVAENIEGKDSDPEFVIPASLLYAVDFDTQLYGDYVVCPLARERPGWMRSVCVERGDNLVQETFKDDGTATVSRAIRPKVRKRRPPNKGMNLTRSTLATGTAALAGYPQCWADRESATSGRASRER